MVGILWVVVGYSLCLVIQLAVLSVRNPATHLFFKGVNSGAYSARCLCSAYYSFNIVCAVSLCSFIITPGLVCRSCGRAIIRFTAYIFIYSTVQSAGICAYYTLDVAS